jgi:hypothetical protein
VALRIDSQRQSMLQAEVLWYPIPPLHPDVAFPLFLHAAVLVLLESAERGFGGYVG